MHPPDDHSLTPHAPLFCPVNIEALAPPPPADGTDHERPFATGTATGRATTRAPSSPIPRMPQSSKPHYHKRTWPSHRRLRCRRRYRVKWLNVFMSPHSLLTQRLLRRWHATSAALRQRAHQVRSKVPPPPTASSTALRVLRGQMPLPPRPALTTSLSFDTPAGRTQPRRPPS